MSSENVVKFLSEPATLASLAAIAAASMMYVTSRPTPLQCPVDPNQQSIEVPVSYNQLNELHFLYIINVLTCNRLEVGKDSKNTCDHSW